MGSEMAGSSGFSQGRGETLDGRSERKRFESSLRVRDALVVTNGSGEGKGRRVEALRRGPGYMDATSVSADQDAQ